MLQKSKTYDTVMGQPKERPAPRIIELIRASKSQDLGHALRVGTDLGDIW